MYILNHNRTRREAAYHRDVGSPQLGSQVLGSPRWDGASSLHHIIVCNIIMSQHHHCFMIFIQVMLPVKLVNAILPLRTTQQFEYW